MNERANIGYTLYCTGRDLLDRGQDADALPVLHESFRVCAHANTAFWISVLLFRSGDETGGQFWATTAFDLNNRSDVIAVHYAKCLAEAGQLDLALIIVSGVLERNDEYGPALRLADRLMDEK
jgi:hypothetical protein